MRSICCCNFGAGPRLAVARAGDRPVPVAPMPFLRLQGRWLDTAGFAIGANVQVVVSRGRLVVEVIEPEQTAR